MLPFDSTQRELKNFAQITVDICHLMCVHVMLPLLLVVQFIVSPFHLSTTLDINTQLHMIFFLLPMTIDFWHESFSLSIELPQNDV